MSPAGWRSLELWAKQRAGHPARQRVGAEARALALEGTAASLIAATDFEMAPAGTLVLTGPFFQEASIAMLNNNGFPKAVRTGVAPAPAITWSEDRVGLRGFAVEVRSRQVSGKAKECSGLDVMN